MVQVSCGIVSRPDGKILITQRGKGAQAGLWEFPGGKRESGETAEDCLVRELIEELDLPVELPHTIKTTVYNGVQFDFVRAWTASEPKLSEHTAMAWVREREMLDYPFCPADEPVARALALNAPRVTEVVWDFDGTLVDTYPVTVQLTADHLRERGVEPDEQRLLALMKDNLRVCFEVIGKEIGVETADMFADYRRRERHVEPAAFPPFAGIPEALAELQRRGCRHWLLTHRDRLSWKILRAHGLDKYFAGGVTDEDHFPRKPDPAALIYLMEKAGADPKQVIMVGDRPIDTNCGRNAGALCCMFDPDGFFPDEPGLKTASAAALPDLICPDPIPD